MRAQPCQSSIHSLTPRQEVDGEDLRVREEEAVVVLDGGWMLIGTTNLCDYSGPTTGSSSIPYYYPVIEELGTKTTNVATWQLIVEILPDRNLGCRLCVVLQCIEERHRTNRHAFPRGYHRQRAPPDERYGTPGDRGFDQLRHHGAVEQGVVVRGEDSPDQAGRLVDQTIVSIHEEQPDVVTVTPPLIEQRAAHRLEHATVARYRRRRLRRFFSQRSNIVVGIRPLRSPLMRVLNIHLYILLRS